LKREILELSLPLSSGDQSLTLEALVRICSAFQRLQLVSAIIFLVTFRSNLRGRTLWAICPGVTYHSKYLPDDYMLFEGTECMNYSPHIYAFEQENIAVTCSGTLDGKA
jgi:polygalacturonase